MKLPRRRFLCLAAGAAVLPSASRVARAQTYPARPVRIVVGVPPGAAFDIVARLTGQWLSPVPVLGVVGALVGGVIGIFGPTYHDRRRRELELEELKASLYAEIADCAARCVSDYLKPWRDWKPTAANPLKLDRVAKFRPKDLS